MENLNQYFDQKEIEHFLKFSCQSLSLEIYLDEKFPQKTSPKVYLLYLPDKADYLCKDGRDFLEDIIKQSWNPSIFVLDVIRATPNFLVFFFLH